MDRESEPEQRQQQKHGHNLLTGHLSSVKFRPPTKFELELDFLSSRLTLVRRKLIFSLNDGRINVASGDANLGQCFEFSDSHWCIGSFTVDINEIGEVRCGERTDRWLDYRYHYPKHKIGPAFSIVFRTHLCKHAIDFACPPEMAVQAEVFLAELNTKVVGCQSNERRCNSCFDDLAQYYYDEHIGNLNLLLQGVKRFNRTRLLHQFCTRLNIDITKRHFTQLLKELVNTRQLSVFTRTQPCPSLEEFITVITQLDRRPELDFIFYKYSILQSPWMSAKGLQAFYLAEQKEVKSVEQCAAEIEAIEMRLQATEEEEGEKNARYLSLKGFYRLFDEGGAFNLFDEKHREVWQDMARPMSHYFIASSHNTYLWGNQLTQPSSYEMYRRALLAGCRCVEIDIWENGSTENLVVYHGHTLTSQLQLKPVLETIKEAAFVTSEYPIILSIENNCRKLASHRTMARLMREVFGDFLYVEPVDGDRDRYPPLDTMKRKIFVKGSKGQATGSRVMHAPVAPTSSTDSTRLMQSVPESPVPQIGQQSEFDRMLKAYRLKRKVRRRNAQRHRGKMGLPEMRNVINDIAEEDEFEDDDDDEEEEEEDESSDAKSEPSSGPPRPGQLLRSPPQVGAQVDSALKAEKKPKETIASELAAIINYFKTRKFTSFEDCKKFSYYEMFSRSEAQSVKLLQKGAAEYRTLTERNMVRVYPSGRRVDSSNYDPIVHWSVGCQMVALNYQTRNSSPMYFNDALFALNGRCGYVLKPGHLRGELSQPTTARLTVKIISGQFWRMFPRNKPNNLEVRVQLFNPTHLKNVSVRKLWRTGCVSNGFNPVWNATFRETIECPELSFLWFKLLNDRTLIGHFMVSFMGMRRGNRYIQLYDPNDQSVLNMARLYVYVSHDYDDDDDGRRP